MKNRAKLVAAFAAVGLSVGVMSTYGSPDVNPGAKLHAVSEKGTVSVLSLAEFAPAFTARLNASLPDLSTPGGIAALGTTIGDTKCWKDIVDTKCIHVPDKKASVVRLSPEDTAAFNQLLQARLKQVSGTTIASLGGVLEGTLDNGVFAGKITASVKEDK